MAQINDELTCLCSQVRFMLDTMLALKNNDMRKIPGYNPEPVERLRKLQRSLVGIFFHRTISWAS